MNETSAVSIRSAARRLALVLPPLRRLYAFTLRLSSENEAMARSLHEITEKYKALQEKYDVLSDESRKAELQLYVLRSDHQRAASRNESLSALLREANQQVELLQTGGAIAAKLAERIEANHQVELLRTGDSIAEKLAERIEQDLSIFYGKLAGRLTMLGSELSGLHRDGASKDSVSTRLYLDLLEAALTGSITRDVPIDPWTKDFDPEIRAIGRDWPRTAQTMIGSARLRNLRMLAEQVLLEDIPGDLIEAGVWRGGACILMRGVLAAYGISNRTVWVADSFQGLPEPDPAQYPADANDHHSAYKELVVSVEDVKKNFELYGLLDEQVKFLKGWFKDTLHTAPVERLSILRLDGDMYSSTIQTLEALYHKVSSGGFVVVDDYILKGCRAAVDDFRAREKVEEPLQEIDGAAVYWRKS
jgi:hypothetical protein